MRPSAPGVVGGSGAIAAGDDEPVDGAAESLDADSSPAACLAAADGSFAGASSVVVAMLPPAPAPALSLPESLPEGTFVFHAGTARAGEGLVSSGGRVLNVVAAADTLTEAVAAAYQGVGAIDFPNAHLRRDIGGRLGE